ncbi:DNA repair protein [Pseudoalteromonas citrea]|uniref:DNA repair protein n=1 Tax=Pseudoalteromonas citrea TaxID=43655 RepID=A0A5S3XRM3_9GAMM|nr:DNA repair ATPase [Pseudoalteromonas citrea]TMP42397.1 DNA repair protein [Pseudoalteromonas citrea]TMP58784.1 DNA repair protein [Pseudoalteromonas citrea]
MTDATQRQALEQGSYELIKRRLNNFGDTLKTQLDALNENRIKEFGCTQLQVAGRVRVRTEHNCVPRDIVIVGNKVIFAYNVFIGLKKNIHVSDVFSVQKLTHQGEHFEVDTYPEKTLFLTDTRFLRDFEELYTYYKETKLQHLYQSNGKLFALFQIGEKLSDLRVFRWQIEPDSTIHYIDNRGEKDLKKSQDYDFEWRSADRSHHVEGRFPHVSLDDKVFVETIGGQLTIKIENNTDDGEGIYTEAVEDKNQSLADCDIEYALVGDLVLIKMRPYREKVWRYFIFNTRSQQVIRQDAIGDACISLPEDHGIIFPGGYYLQTGQTRYFEEKSNNLEFHRQIKSPNGEDVLYVFYEPNEGRYALFSYNIIEKSLQNPIYCHGYGLYDNGQTLTFKADSDEAERVHPIQIWNSAFVSAEHAANAPTATSLLGKIGNPDLVRGLSDLYSVQKAIHEQNPSVYHYEDLIGLSKTIFDRYHWLSDVHFEQIQQTLHSIFETSEQVLDEFEKVTAIQQKAKSAITEIEAEYQSTCRDIRPESFKLASEFVAGLSSLNALKGKLVSLEDVKFIDVTALQGLQTGVDDEVHLLSLATAAFLQQDLALKPYHDTLTEITQLSEQSERVSELKEYIGELDLHSAELDSLNHTMLDLEIDDSRVRTQILEDISAVYALLNRTKANIEIRRKSLGSVEAKAEFSARFKLFSQSITNGLNNAKTPEQCDEQLSRLLIQLEELESQFSDYDEFLTDIISKRDDVYDSFETHKQSLIDVRQRRALNLANAAQRILEGVIRRAQSFTELDALNTYFAADPMISKLRTLSTELKELGDENRADEIHAKLKASKDQGIRSLRDKQDIYTDGGNTVSIGKHAFSVNKQLLDLTLLPRDGELMLHLTGTDYFSSIKDQEALTRLAASKSLWEQSLVSESAAVYRGEYLAAKILLAAKNPAEPLTEEMLEHAHQQDKLLSLVQKFAEPRYQEGYEKGIHDYDCSVILGTLLTQKQSLALLIYPAGSRAVAQLFMAQLSDSVLAEYAHQAANAKLMDKHFLAGDFKATFTSHLTSVITDYIANIPTLIARFEDFSPTLCAEYMTQELAAQKMGKPLNFVISAKAKSLAENFIKEAKIKGFDTQLEQAASTLECTDKLAMLYFSWLDAYSKQFELPTSIQNDAANYALLTRSGKVSYRCLDAESQVKVSGLLGQHVRIEEQSLMIDYAEFNARTSVYINDQVPLFIDYHKIRTEILSAQKQVLQLDEFKAKPLSSFVRNQLIDKVYFPLIGDNLAKQIGSSGKSKRTDLMGMLLLISPPGYGKTTLIEYVANRLGLTFVKVNCPSIGHDQVSLDPAQAINATAQKEIEKINQSFEMGNNVMLYLDDIQHTNPEFLQKFISLCDGSRRIDGVWEGHSKTYDLRGKKFAVVMAGNPYTESGASFKIPDMLANRADIYNLGDTLAGCENEFAMSFIENALTSNAVIAPLANRNMADLYKLVRMSQGEDISLNELEYGYSQAEVNEIQAVITKLIWIRETVLKVNAQYIASAAQDDKYRTEPPFKLQGSYRNMNKMAEKVVAAMNDEELENLVSDHYRGEAQTLSKGSEENLLKLAELRGMLTDNDAHRWAQIKQDFCRANKLDSSSSPTMLIVEQIGLLHESLTEIAERLNKANLSHDYTTSMEELRASVNQLDNHESLDKLSRTLEESMASSRYYEVLTQLSDGLTTHNTTQHNHHIEYKKLILECLHEMQTRAQNTALQISDTLKQQSDKQLAQKLELSSNHLEKMAELALVLKDAMHSSARLNDTKQSTADILAAIESGTQRLAHATSAQKDASDAACQSQEASYVRQVNDTIQVLAQDLCSVIETSSNAQSSLLKQQYQQSEMTLKSMFEMLLSHKSGQAHNFEATPNQTFVATEAGNTFAQNNESTTNEKDSTNQCYESQIEQLIPKQPLP